MSLQGTVLKEYFTTEVTEYHGEKYKNNIMTPCFYLRFLAVSYVVFIFLHY